MKVKRECPICEGQGKAEFETDIPEATFDQYMMMSRFILAEVAEEYMVGVGDLVGKGRQAYLIPARFRAIRRLRDELELTLKTIGFVMGGRDHSTIIHALKKTA